MIDEFEFNEPNKLSSTPEGKLLIAILVRAIEDLDKQLKKGKPLYLLNWFFSNNEVFDLACYVLGWHKDVFRRRLLEKIKTGSIVPSDGISERTIRRRRQRERERAMLSLSTLNDFLTMEKVKQEIERAKKFKKELKEKGDDSQDI
jgi:hypothetical protein